MRIAGLKLQWMILAATAIVMACTWAIEVRAEGESKSRGYLTAVGASTYRIYCANCHGKFGLGDGQVAPYLKTEPTDLTQLTKSHDGTFPAEDVFRTIDGREEVKLHGRREMPIWGDALSRPGPDPEAAIKERIEALVAFIRSIQK